MRNRHIVAVALFGLLLLPLAFGAGGADQKAAPAKPKLTANDIDGMMQSLSNWGRWGKEDELGTLNLITAERRRRAAALVRDGVSVSLARNLVAAGDGAAAGFGHKMTALPQSADYSGASDEYRLAYHGFTLTHIDSLCHMSYKGRLYNGFSKDEVTERGAGKLSIINARQGIFTRGVLMDIPRLLGVKYLEGGRAIYPADLEAWENAAGFKVESGDALLIRTGRGTRDAAEKRWDIMKNSAGLHASCLPWLKERDVAVIGSDLALDVLPSGVDGVDLPVHAVVLVAMGTPILDNCDFEALSEAAAARKRWEFLLTVAPLAVPGGTGSPINPLATF